MTALLRACVLAGTLAVTINVRAPAQQCHVVTFAVPGEGRDVCIELSQFDGAVRGADHAIRAYIDSSLGFTRDGQREGFAAFKAWKTARESQARSSVELLVFVLTSVAATAGALTMPPPWAAAVAVAGVALTDAAERMSQFDAGDHAAFWAAYDLTVEVYLNEMKSTVQHEYLAREDVQENLYHLPLHYVLLVGTTPAAPMPPNVRSSLRDLGFPEPTRATQLRFKAEILAREIAAVLQKENPVYTPYLAGLVGASMALRVVFPGQPEMYCEPELRLTYPHLIAEPTPECLRWRAQHPRPTDA